MAEEEELLLRDWGGAGGHHGERHLPLHLHLARGQEVQAGNLNVR